MIEWPAWRYGPNGAADVFNDESEVPHGWKDHPSKVAASERINSKPAPLVAGPTTGDGPVAAKNNSNGPKPKTKSKTKSKTKAEPKVEEPVSLDL